MPSKHGQLPYDFNSQFQEWWNHRCYFILASFGRILCQYFLGNIFLLWFPRSKWVLVSVFSYHLNLFQLCCLSFHFSFGWSEIPECFETKRNAQSSLVGSEAKIWLKSFNNCVNVLYFVKLTITKFYVLYFHICENTLFQMVFSYLWKYNIQRLILHWSTTMNVLLARLFGHKLWL